MAKVKTSKKRIFELWRREYPQDRAAVYNALEGLRVRAAAEADQMETLGEEWQKKMAEVVGLWRALAVLRAVAGDEQPWRG